MVDLKLILVGTSSTYWFDAEAKPPPFSFVIVTPSRPLHFTAPDLQTYVACVQGLEAILAEKHGVRDYKMFACGNSIPKIPGKGHLRATHRTRLETETESEFTFQNVSMLEFLSLYDQVLVETCGDVNMESWWDSSSSAITSLSRRVRTSHSSNRGFLSELTVTKSMSTLFEAQGRRGNSSGCLLILEENAFSGAPYADYLKLTMRWTVWSTKGGGISGALSCGIGMVKETMLKSRLCAEVKKGIQLWFTQWEMQACECLRRRSDRKDTQGSEDDATWKAGELAMSQLLEKDALLAQNDGSIAAGAVHEAAFSPTLQAVLWSPIGEHVFSGSFNGDGVETKQDSSDHLMYSESDTSLYRQMHPRHIEGFICPECGVISGTQGELVAHFTIFHSEEGGKADPGDNVSPTFSPPLIPVQSPECFQSFCSPDDLTQHYDIEHGDTGKQNVLGENLTAAEDIGDFFMSTLTATLHANVTGVASDTGSAPSSEKMKSETTWETSSY